MCPEAAYVDALVADLEFALPSIWGRRIIVDIHRRRHAEPLFGRGDRPAAGRGSRARSAVAGCRNHARGQSGNVRAREIQADSVRRASTGSRSASRASIPGICARSVGCTTKRRRARLPKRRSRSSATSIWISCMRCRGRRLREARADVAAALAFAPPHLSFYQLTLEPNTLFHRHPPPLPDDDAAADIEDAVHSMLAEAGYRHYETSAHARAGSECRHNLNYWRFGDYLGIGAGAHSKLSFPDRIVRQVRFKQPQAVSRAHSRRVRRCWKRAEIARDDIGFEFMLNALRLAEGVPGVAVRRAHGVSVGARGACAGARGGARVDRKRSGRTFARRRSAGGF